MVTLYKRPISGPFKIDRGRQPERSMLAFRRKNKKMSFSILMKQIKDKQKPEEEQ